MAKTYKPDFRKPLEVFTEFHRRELWGFLENLYKWEGMPDTVDLRFFNRNLLSDGYAPLLTYGGDLITTQGSPHGLDRQLKPTMYTISNPVLKTGERTIGKDCAVCFNTLNYRQPESCDLLVEIFARRLAQIDLSMEVSLKNSRASIIATVRDANEGLKTADALNRIYDGEAAVLTTSEAWTGDGAQIFPLKPKDNIISAELADARTNVMADFYRYLGIDTLAVDKKERTNLAEMESNDQQIYINGLRMLHARELFCDDVKKVFGLDLSVSFNKEVIRDAAGEHETGADTSAQS